MCSIEYPKWGVIGKSDSSYNIESISEFQIETVNDMEIEQWYIGVTKSCSKVKYKCLEIKILCLEDVVLSRISDWIE